MRILSFKGCKWDKKYVIVFLIALICAIISGIVLFNLISINIFFKEYAEDYIYYVFNFKNGSLIFSHFLSELLYLYLFFIIAYFTKFKYLTILLLFIRGLFFAVYAAILVSLNSFGGVTVAIFVYIPAAGFSFFFCCFVVEACRIINRKIVFVFPAALALINTLILVILVNIVFRVVIVIV